jgi:Putative adhesin
MNGGTIMTYMSETGSSATDGYPAGAWRPSGPLRMTPGRWVAVAVAVPVALALIGWTGFSLVASLARGTYPFSYTVPVHDGQVSVSVNAGDVTLREAPGSSTARLAGTVQYGLVRPGISENTTPTGADVGMDCGGVSTGNCGMNAALSVPPRTAVTLWSNGGDIDVAGFTSGMTLSAGGGNMTASDLAGRLVLDTGGGDLTGSALTGTIQISTEGGNVNAGNLTGPMRLDTGGGDLTGNGFTGDLQMFTEGGNIDANAVVSQKVAIASGGGDVTVGLSQPPADLTIAASGGNITVILPPGNTKYDISTPDTQGGNVNYPSTLASPTSDHVITIDSGGGDITISQAS